MSYTRSYTREQRLNIRKQIYNNEFSKNDAATKYKISEGTARDYMRLYQDVNNLPPKNRIQKDQHMVKISTHSSKPDISEYGAMTKDELIQELVKSQIQEAWLKKGYEVKGVGANKTIIVFKNWNTK